VDGRLHTSLHLLLLEKMLQLLLHILLASLGVSVTRNMYLACAVELERVGILDTGHDEERARCGRLFDTLLDSAGCQRGTCTCTLTFTTSPHAHRHDTLTLPPLPRRLHMRSKGFLSLISDRSCTLCTAQLSANAAARSCSAMRGNTANLIVFTRVGLHLLI
jgi:hypothetical protein